MPKPKMVTGAPFTVLATALLFQALWHHASSKCVYDCASSDSTSGSPSSEAQTLDTPITDEEIRRELIRLEGLRILEKLRLDKPPDVNVSLNDLPAPVTQRLQENPFSDEPITVDSMEDAPGRLKSVYIVGERLRRGRGRTHMCNDQHGRPAVCIEFEINGRPLINQFLQNATLWLNLHLNHEEDDRLPGSPNDDSIIFNLSVSALAHRHEHETVVATAETVASKFGHWVGVDLTEYIRYEMEGRTKSHRITLLVSCDRDDRIERPPIAFHLRGRHRPFLELQTRRSDSDQADVRRKRSKLCGPSSTAETECCLETLYVNFTEIGWHTWILQPRGYETGYCKGRCQSTATRNYNAIMKTILQRRRNEQQQAPQAMPVDPEMAQCCSPTRMLPLEILYAKVENNHEQLSTAVLPAMIVDSCKC